MLLLLASLALAGDPTISLVGGLGAAIGPPSAGATASGRLWWDPHPRWGLELGVREGAVTDDLRTVGIILAGARWRAPSGAFARALFAHHHEVPMALARAHPVQATLGSLDGIRHRTGPEIGVGWDVAMFPDQISASMGWVFAASVAVLPDPHWPPVYGHLELGFRLGLGRPARSVPPIAEAAGADGDAT